MPELPMTFLMVGLVLGMKHALEADHLAAVAALATRSRSVGDTLVQGIAWGMGHTLTLLLFGGIVMAMQAVVPSQLAASLESAVGVMLIALGADVLRRCRDRPRGATPHPHLHLHPHPHPHPARDPSAAPKAIPFRALLVGMMHGMAGTAALIVIVAGTAPTLSLAVGQILVFGVGSIAGMAALSIAIAVPLRTTAVAARRVEWWLKAMVGVLSIAIGIATLVRTLPSSGLG